MTYQLAIRKNLANFLFELLLVNRIRQLKLQKEYVTSLMFVLYQTQIQFLLSATITNSKYSNLQ